MQQIDMWENKQNLLIHPFAFTDIAVSGVEKKPSQTHALFLKFWDAALSAEAAGSYEVFESSGWRIEAGQYELFGNLFFDMRVQLLVWQDTAAVRHDEDERKVCYNFSGIEFDFISLVIIVYSQQFICLYHRPKRVKRVHESYPLRSEIFAWSEDGNANLLNNIVQIWQVLFSRITCWLGNKEAV